MPIPKGTAVKQVVPVITGTTLQTKFNDDTNQFEYLVEYTESDGTVSQRWFNETEVEAV